MSSEASCEYFFLAHTLYRTKAFNSTCLHLICGKTLGKLQSPHILGSSNPARYHALNDFSHFHTNRTSKNSNDLRFHCLHHNLQKVPPPVPPPHHWHQSLTPVKNQGVSQSNQSSALVLPFWRLQHGKLTSFVFTSNYKIQNHSP